MAEVLKCFRCKHNFKRKRRGKTTTIKSMSLFVVTKDDDSMDMDIHTGIDLCHDCTKVVLDALRVI